MQVLLELARKAASLVQRTSSCALVFYSSWREKGAVERERVDRGLIRGIKPTLLSFY